MPSAPKYARVLLKVSGEALMGSAPYGIDLETVERIAEDVRQAFEAGTQICMVIGGGNIFRGLSAAAKGIERATADYMGIARDRDERAGGSGSFGTDRRAVPRAIRHSYGVGL
ncbi:MAG: hypothetical protein WDM89_02180 [Rhizomicrobium sp.]